jgi:hypothetical protein
MDFETEFFRIASGVFSPDDNLPDFPMHATPREWQMHERVSDDCPVNDRSRPVRIRGLLTDSQHVTQATWNPAGTPPPRLPGDGWVDPRNGHVYLPGETIPDYHNHQRATWEHPGNPNPFLQGPRNASEKRDEDNS